MKLYFIEIPSFEGRGVCTWINEHDLADYVLHLTPCAEVGITQCILRLPDNFPVEKLLRA